MRLCCRTFVIWLPSIPDGEQGIKGSPSIVAGQSLFPPTIRLFFRRKSSFAICHSSRHAIRHSPRHASFATRHSPFDSSVVATLPATLAHGSPAKYPHPYLACSQIHSWRSSSTIRHRLYAPSLAVPNRTAIHGESTSIDWALLSDGRGRFGFGTAAID